MFQSLWWRGGVWLAGSAVLSKFLGLWRDRLMIQQFGQGDVLDAIFTAFRIPDFFFFLLIGGTVGTVLIPRFKKLSEAEQQQLLHGFFIRTFVGFGSICLLGVLFSPLLASWIGNGLDPSLQQTVASLSRWLFGSIFLLSLTSVFASYLQSHEKFRVLAIGPILYTLSLCLSILFFGNNGNIAVIGIGAVLGSFIYFLLVLYSWSGEAPDRSLVNSWNIPKKALKNLKSDFIFRVLNNSAFQINQTIDVYIAGFLMAGAVGAFSMGTALGSILLTVIGIPLSNTFFPQLSEQKTWKQRCTILRKPLLVIWALCLPVSLIGILFPSQLLQLVYTLQGQTLALATPVFQWTIASLPMMCSIPILSRSFHASGDSKTPFWVTTFALTISTIFAVYYTFILTNLESIQGLALANFIASGLSFVIFIALLLKKQHAQ